jgi:hypothetical protein
VLGGVSYFVQSVSHEFDLGTCCLQNYSELAYRYTEALTVHGAATSAVEALGGTPPPAPPAVSTEAVAAVPHH